METKYRKFLSEVELKNTENVEKKLLKYERDAAGRRLETTLKNLAKMNETLLSRNQLRRRYILMGDINLLFFNDKEKWRERQFYFDLAIRYYKRAIQNSESEIQKNMIIRRIAQLYMGNKEWQKALDIFQEANTNPMMPEERWRMKMNMAECYKHLGQYYKVLQLLDQVAEDGRDDPHIWGKALREAADLKLQASENDKILAALLKEKTKATGEKPLIKDAPEKKAESDDEDKTEAQIRNEKILEARKENERQKHNENVLKTNAIILQGEALEDYQEIVKELPELNEESSLAKIGILSIYVQKKKAQAAFELATKIYESSAPATAKAKALMLLAKLEIARHNKRYALDLLIKCQKEYGKTSLRTEILMKLYNLYTDKDIEKWENAFDIAREIMTNNPEKWAVERVMQDFSPGKNKLLTVLSQNNNKDKKYIEKTRQMLDRLKKLDPEIWDSIENEAYFIFANLLFLSRKYKQADEELIKCLNTPGNSKKLKEKIYYLDLECAIAAQAAPPVIVARAKRYLFWYPEGENYKEALMALLDGYYDMQMYTEARAVAKKIYIDYLNTARKSKEENKSSEEIEAEEEIWLKAFARIGEIYEKLGYDIQANKLIKAHAKQLMSTIWAPEVFMAWSRVAESQGQLYEAARRLQVAIPYVHDPNEKAKMYVAQYLLKLKIGKIRDFNKSKLLLEKIQESKKIDPELKTELTRKLSEGMLEYAFKNNRPQEFNELLDFVVKKFSGETWPEYWALRSLGALFGTAKLETLSKRHEETLQKELAELPKDKETVGFIRKQLKLINNLVSIENTIEALKIERGLGI
jgi:hypothetical protein